MYRSNQKKGAKKAKAAKTRQNPKGPIAHENPSYEAGVAAKTGPPEWADPNVPFLSRGEATSQLAARGNVDGDFIVRQSDKLPHGYIITSVSKGVIANSQLKLANGKLMYGSLAVGGNLNEAISGLQNRVKIAPASGPPYHLKGGKAQPGYLDVTGASADDDDADA